MLAIGDRVMLLTEVNTGSWVMLPGARGTLTGKPGQWVGGTRGRLGNWHITFDSRSVGDPTYWCPLSFFRKLDVIEVLGEVERRT